MNAIDLETFAAALESRARELARSVAQHDPITIERAADPFDSSLLAAERESSAQILALDSELLREIEAARDRLRKGTYGLCLCCDEEIAPKRLKAIPWAAYCMACQAKAEEGALLRQGLSKAA